MISVILPTFNESENIKHIVPAISRVFREEDIEGEIIVVDDNSPDGTAATASALGDEHPVRVHLRRNERGLSKAVMEGFRLAEGDICLVMDADLSHPVEKIPALIEPILEGKCDATVGSRYITGGGCENWPFTRKIISKGAGFLARGVTSLSDPTSGFMAIRKNIINGVQLDPKGWKIVLEVTVKTNPRILEVPIIFKDRREGESKLGVKAQVDYFHHLWRLYEYKHPTVFEFIKFCLVGFSGLFVDTAVLVAFVGLLSLDPRVAAVFAFFVAVSWNYIFDRIWAFKIGRSIKISYSYISFIVICLFGLGIRIGVMHLFIEYAGMGKSPWYILSSMLGIVAATILNFFGTKYIAFSRIFHRHEESP
jgi:dolichol-phosphate mannosyltransferase